MIRMSLQQASAIIGGTLVGKSYEFQGVSTDSRSSCQGRLFIALKGVNFDGNAFCQQAIDQGAVALLCNTPQDTHLSQIICDDSEKAMANLARAWLRICQVDVVGVTGSNGKTTVKNMLQSVLSRKYRTFASQGNMNNEIGVPLSVFGIDKQDEIAVLEMGAAQKGDIRHLTGIAKPQVAVVTNVSAAHVGRFGSVETIAETKGELFQALGKDGLAVVNRDDRFAGQWLQSLTCDHVGFGFSEQADVRISRIEDGLATVRCADGQELTFALPIGGVHNVMNAAAVIAVARHFQVEAEDIVDGLQRFQPEQGRLQNMGRVGGVYLINDCYNANPASVMAAIDVLSGCARPAVLVLGDMAELGSESEAWHRRIGEYAAQHGIDRLYTVGPYARYACQGMGGHTRDFADVPALLAGLRSEWPDSGTVLVKASRSMQLERVVEALMQAEKSA